MHEQVYLHLVCSGGSQTAREVADALGLSPQLARNLLEDLDRSALIITTLTKPHGYMASPPEIALESLINRQAERLAQVRLFAKELQSEYREAAAEGGSAGDLVEVVVGRERVVRYFAQLIENAKYRLDAFNKPPYVAFDDADDLLSAQGVRIGHGMVSRSVYEADGSDGQLTLAIAERSARLGEHARVAPKVPMKLALFDRRTGLVPLRLDEPGLGVLVIHASPLLDALIALFDSVWARAVPLPTGGAETTGELDERSRQILLLMSGGLKDESIARSLGMSRRTVQTRVSSIMTALGAHNRFQAALLAQERGWIDNKR
jgi:DNA-binding CsgD family transcriptional regulator